MVLIKIKKKNNQGYFTIDLKNITCSCSKFRKSHICPHIKTVVNNLEEYLSVDDIIQLNNYGSNYQD